MANGRAITAQDLFRYRGYSQRCARLSPEAALVAVLVERLGGRERVEIHPGDLVKDLRKRLDWRDAPLRFGPEVIGACLRRLGFRSAGRDGKGGRYEIRWERIWGLNPLAAGGHGANLLALTGAEFLWLLAEEQGLFFAPRLWCAQCQQVTATLWGDWTGAEESVPCLECGGPVKLVDPRWLHQASARVRRAIREDTSLLPRVKAQWEAAHDGARLPPLPEPFGWLNREWEQARRPGGRPASVLVCYQLAHTVDRLESAGVSSEKIVQLLREPNKMKRDELFKRLPGQVHRFLGSVGEGLLADLPSVSRARLQDAVWWARRKWTNPTARLRGERLFLTAERQRAIPPNVPTYASGLPARCPKCGSGNLEQLLESGLVWVRCASCAWDRFLKPN